MPDLDTTPTPSRWFSSLTGLALPWALYGAWKLGYAGAGNLLAFLAICYPVFTLLVSAAREIDDIDVDGHLAALPEWTDSVHRWSDMTLVFVMAWHGWFWMAAAWLLGAFMEIGMKRNVRKAVEARENGRSCAKDIQETADRIVEEADLDGIDHA